MKGWALPPRRWCCRHPFRCRSPKVVRRQCLLSSKATNGQVLSASVFTNAFGKDATVLDSEWRAFFGWAKTPDDSVGYLLLSVLARCRDLPSARSCPFVP